MADYKFDGEKLKHRGTTVANVRGDNIRKGSGSTTVANVRGDDIRSGSGSTKLANLRGDDIRQGSGSSKIGTMRDVDNAIDGPGRVVKAALWLMFVR